MWVPGKLYAKGSREARPWDCVGWLTRLECSQDVTSRGTVGQSCEIGWAVAKQWPYTCSNHSRYRGDHHSRSACMALNKEPTDRTPLHRFGQDALLLKSVPYSFQHGYLVSSFPARIRSLSLLANRRLSIIRNWLLLE